MERLKKLWLVQTLALLVAWLFWPWSFFTLLSTTLLGVMAAITGVLVIAVRRYVRELGPLEQSPFMTGMLFSLLAVAAAAVSAMSILLVGVAAVTEALAPRLPLVLIEGAWSAVVAAMSFWSSMTIQPPAAAKEEVEKG